MSVNGVFYFVLLTFSSITVVQVRSCETCSNGGIRNYESTQPSLSNTEKNNQILTQIHQLMAQLSPTPTVSNHDFTPMTPLNCPVPSSIPTSPPNALQCHAPVPSIFPGATPATDKTVSAQQGSIVKSILQILSEPTPGTTQRLSAPNALNPLGHPPCYQNSHSCAPAVPKLQVPVRFSCCQQLGSPDILPNNFPTSGTCAPAMPTLQVPVRSSCSQQSRLPDNLPSNLPASCSCASGVPTVQVPAQCQQLATPQILPPVPSTDVQQPSVSSCSCNNNPVGSPAETTNLTLAPIVVLPSLPPEVPGSPDTSCCGPPPKSTAILPLPPVYLRPVDAPVIHLPDPVLPPPRIISNKCSCTKVVVKPQLYQRIVHEKKNLRFLKKDVRLVKDQVHYSANPKCCKSKQFKRLY